ncbi:MAG: aspartate/glutamate racemase family protein, partial [Cyclobacteriaceae bacterium]|nr:aspartate/glutamate racemase family protein [Cyclobacteriaceae bacterium]
KKNKMKIIGLIGGMSWESSVVYYEIVNKKVNELFGGFSSCKCLMYSVDFAEIETLQHKGDWGKLNKLMVDAAKKLYNGGAELIVLCTNTMHLCSEEIIKSIPVPFLHIADAAGEEIKYKNLRQVGLLGTKFTMEKDFYKQILRDKYSIETIIPDENEREEIHRIIYEELVLGKIEDDSRETYKKIINSLQERGAEGVILGCTEIPLLISSKDVEIPIFDTTRIHAEKAVKWAIN